MTPARALSPDPGWQLARALVAQAAAAGLSIEIERRGERPWASATFAGTRHHLRVTGCATPDWTDWLDALPEAEIPLRGHFVADIAIDRSLDAAAKAHAALTILTIEEG